MRPSERHTLDYSPVRRSERTPEPEQLPPLHPLPHADQIPTRDLLGVPVAMTDYSQTMDVMDGLIAREERGWVCAVAVRFPASESHAT